MKDSTVNSKYGDLSNEELVSLAQKGESAALAYLTLKFSNINRAKYPAGYLEIEDLNQEGMIGFLSAVKTYSADKGATFETYASKCINNRISSIAKRTVKKSDTANPEIIDCATELSNPLVTISENENIDEFMLLLSVKLSEKERKVLYMYLNGFSTADIVKKLNISNKSADNALQRAKRKLKQHYNGEN